MQNDIFQGNWVELKSKVQQTWTWMTEDDLMQIEDNQETIYQKLQQHYGYSRDEAVNAVASFKNKYH